LVALSLSVSPTLLLSGDGLLEAAGDVALRGDHGIEARVGPGRLRRGGRRPAQREGDDDRGDDDAGGQYDKGYFHAFSGVPLTPNRSKTISRS
jgi:hypothetical protein